MVLKSQEPPHCQLKSRSATTPLLIFPPEEQSSKRVYTYGILGAVSGNLSLNSEGSE